MNNDIEKKMHDYRSARNSLNQAIRKRYPKGRRIELNSLRYQKVLDGEIIDHCYKGDPEMLLVRVEHGLLTPKIETVGLTEIIDE